MRSKPVWLGITLAIAALTGLGGCSSARNVVTVHGSPQITKGNELTDLQRALQEGAINQKEYEEVRRVLLRRKN